ncbi:MAG: right-handed parallel beta-helix repeat-containing protein [Oscillospiraceae bacterium]
MTIDVKSHGILPGNTADNTLPLRRLLEGLQGSESVELLFGEGEYHFRPSYATELLLCIPNHDEDALKRITFPLISCKNLSIKGNNTSFIFHADIIPFYLYACENVNITGISIDYAQPIYSEAVIISAAEKQMEIEIDKEKYPFIIKNKRLFFPREGRLQPLYRWLEMDGERNAPVYKTLDLAFGEELNGLTPVFEEKENGVITITLNSDKERFLPTSRSGNKLILRHHLRTHPAFYAAYCTDISIKSTNVYHASGMAFIAEHTRNICLDNFNVKINPENPRVFTATADATHFVYCGGVIKINNCLFENQLDDPINIHGIYAKIDTICSDDTIIVQLVHDQQKGVSMGSIGESLRVLDNETMLPYHEAIIKNIRPLNKDFAEIQLSSPCKSMKQGHVIENLAFVPDVVITNCVFRNNRARGPLLTSGGKVLVENNYFSVPGAAVLIEGDCNNWFESGATSDITIQNNVFDNCSYVPDWGFAPIQVTPSTIRADGDTRFHKKLCVQNNVFNCFDNRILYARHIETIEFTNNKIAKTSAFPPIDGDAFHTENVNRFLCDNNDL